MKTALWVALIAIVGLAASSRWLAADKAEAAGRSASSSSLFTVARGDLRIAIEENGSLAAQDNVKISPQFEGEGKIMVLVEEGKSVVPSDVLIEFDKTQLEQQIRELENNLVQYEIELEAAKANREIQERDNQASIEKAELGLQMAQLTLERYKQGDAPNELRKLNLATEKAKSELERGKEQFRQVPELVRQGFLTRIQEEEERIRLREAEIGDENARKDLELHEAYTAPMELKMKESEVRNGERELENARKKSDINLKEKQAALTQRESQVQATKADLEHQRIEIGYYTVKAENPGVVYYGDPEHTWWRQEVKVGNSVYQGQTLITIPDCTTMQVILQVHEADIDKLKLDMPAVVTVDSRKGESFSGKITEIASVASSGNWADQANKTFKIEITLDSKQSDLRAGVTAKAEIEIETVKDALYVPIHAIVPEGGKHLAFVVVDGKPVEREVKIGKNNAHHVQVLGGLSEGEQVLLYDPRSEGQATDGQSKDEAEPAKQLPGAPVE
ncbi:MAG: efflux RND transporter periplasmic adaptor subunit [Planctomycetes bacterium]|nr:efflux RND transporter periplasmic adaptor subunit [Planctomycetota bacterium]